MTNRNRKTRTPGEPVKAEQMPPQEKVTVEQTPEEPVFSDEQKAAIEKEVQRKLAEERAARIQSGEFPDQSEIDATKIKRAVMTLQGWVVPAPAEAIKKGADDV